MNLSEKLDAVEMKVRELAIKLERFRKENISLREENKRLAAQVERLRESASDLEAGPSHLAPTGEQLPGEAGQEVLTDKLKDQLTLYIREIDKCIEWLDNN